MRISDWSSDVCSSDLQKSFEDFTVNVAEGNLDTYDGYNAINGSGSDKDILFMSKFLKKSSRQIDLRTKQITYNEMNTLLAKRGLYLDKPDGNRINLMRRLDIDGNQLDSPKRIAHIGFHGWSKEVSRKDIDIVREASKLDARNGYDSQSFFNGLEDPLSLIKKI